MKELAQRIATLSKEDYDKELFSIDEIGKKINQDTAKGLKLCKEFNLNGTVLASEIIHSKAQLAALREDTPDFRSIGVNDEKILELKEFISELEKLLIEKIAHGTRLNKYRANEIAHAEAFEALTPLADALVAIDKQLKEHIADIRILEASHLPNPINVEVFRLMNEMARPGGLNG